MLVLHFLAIFDSALFFIWQIMSPLANNFSMLFSLVTPNMFLSIFVLWKNYSRMLTIGSGNCFPVLVMWIRILLAGPTKPTDMARIAICPGKTYFQFFVKGSLSSVLLPTISCSYNLGAFGSSNVDFYSVLIPDYCISFNLPFSSFSSLSVFPQQLIFRVFISLF